MFTMGSALRGQSAAAPTLAIDFAVPRGPVLNYYLASLGVSFSVGLEGYDVTNGTLGPSPDTTGYASNWASGDSVTITLPASPAANSLSMRYALNSGSGLSIDLVPRDGGYATYNVILAPGGGGTHTWSSPTVFTHPDKVALSSVVLTCTAAFGYYGVDTLLFGWVP